MSGLLAHCAHGAVTFSFGRVLSLEPGRYPEFSAVNAFGLVLIAAF